MRSDLEQLLGQDFLPYLFPVSASVGSEVLLLCRLL